MGYRSSKNKTDYILKKMNKDMNENYTTESRTIKNLIKMNSEEIKMSINNFKNSQDKNYENFIRRNVNIERDISIILSEIKTLKDIEQSHYVKTNKRFEILNKQINLKFDDANIIIKSLSKIVVILLLVIIVLTLCVNFGI